MTKSEIKKKSEKDNPQAARNEEIVNSEDVSNISGAQAEMLFIGAVYKNPDLLVEYEPNIRSKYDFSDEGSRFLYESAKTMYKRGLSFNLTNIQAFFNETSEKRLAFNKSGGWNALNHIKEVADENSVKAYFNTIKKYSLLREYERNGFNIKTITEMKGFKDFEAVDIYRIIRGRADRVRTVIMTNQESEIVNENISDMLLGYMAKPDMGEPLPYPIMNSMFRGLKLGSTMGVGMLSNSGKTRFMTKIIAYLTLVLKQRVLLLLNEMTVEDIRKCLITTVINNPEFKELHGIDITKPERELALGLYKDRNGEYIYQKLDSNGDPLETPEEYIKRVEENSDEFHKVMEITKWVEDKTQELIYAKDLATGYDDRTLEFEIRRAHVTQGINYWFYDTFKSDVNAMGEWAAMKASETKLTGLSQELGMFGYLSFQLTDDAEYAKPNELTSNNIANSKQIKHGLWTLELAKEIPKADFSKYGYYQSDEEWGKDVVCDLKEDKRYYVFNTDKNRFGDKKKIVMEVDLDLNTWIEKGELAKK